MYIKIVLLILIYIICFSLSLEKGLRRYKIEKDKNYCPFRRPVLCPKNLDPVCAFYFKRTVHMKKRCSSFTAPNSCFACLDREVQYWIQGQC